MVLTQPLSFVATANAIVHAGAEPVFLDVERSTLGLSPDAVRKFLEARCLRGQGVCRLGGHWAARGCLRSYAQLWVASPHGRTVSCL